MGTLFIEPGSPWENGYVECFNGKLRDELLDREVFDTLLEAKVLIERWRGEYNTVRPHSALGYRPPTPEVVRVGPPATAPAPWLIGTTLTSGLVSSVGAGEVLLAPHAPRPAAKGNRSRGWPVVRCPPGSCVLRSATPESMTVGRIRRPLWSFNRSRAIDPVRCDGPRP